MSTANIIAGQSGVTSTATASSTSIQPESQFWTTTRSSTFSLQINWTIENFSFYIQTNTDRLSQAESITHILSPQYPVPGIGNVHFFLSLYPNGDSFVESANHLALYLHCRSTSFPLPVYAKYQFSLVDGKGKACHWNIHQCKYTCETSWGIRRLISHLELFNRKNDLLPEDRLTIGCRVEICLETVPDSATTIQTMGIDPNLLEKQLSNDLGFLLDHGGHSDVVLAVDGTQIPAHKAILCARSPVFACMFSHSETREAQEGLVKIVDVPVETFKDLLGFIYTGTLPCNERLTVKLLAAADKYQVITLKSACESYLATSLSVESVATVLLYADLHSATKLKTNVIYFIVGNFFRVIQTSEWKQMAKEYRELVKEVYMKIAEMIGRRGVAQSSKTCAASNCKCIVCSIKVEN